MLGWWVQSSYLEPYDSNKQPKIFKNQTQTFLNYFFSCAKLRDIQPEVQNFPCRRTAKVRDGDRVRIPVLLVRWTGDYESHLHRCGNSSVSQMQEIHFYLLGTHRLGNDERSRGKRRYLKPFLPFLCLIWRSLLVWRTIYYSVATFRGFPAELGNMLPDSAGKPREVAILYVVKQHRNYRMIFHVLVIVFLFQKLIISTLTILLGILSDILNDLYKVI